MIELVKIAIRDVARSALHREETGDRQPDGAKASGVD
jgi:hypothetical protein